MFISVRRFEIRDDRLTPGVVTELVRSELVPEFEQIDGFREYFLMDSRHPKLTSITICDTEIAAGQTNRASQAFIQRSFRPGAVERIDVTTGNVLLAPSVIGHM
ncbi:MAG: hypothetical protein JWM90_1763 [Thermoleophilia bacterium]|nr:hypothetical protein [Thermoleophilia bacterium]